MIERDASLAGHAATAERISVLDGVRGVAIGLVLLVHFTPDLAMPNRPLEWIKKGGQAGWSGVDLFFVLSGMLITEILLRSRGTSGAARKFYARRCLRILPLYLTSLAFVFGILPWFPGPAGDPRFSMLQSTQGWYWAHCANVIFALYGSSAMTSNSVSLSHLWSLSVEEHFYLLWPLLVWKVPERRLLWIALGIVATAVCLRIGTYATLSAEQLRGLLVQTPMRMDGLAVGAVLALLLRTVPTSRLRTGAAVLLPSCGAALLGEFVIRKGLWSTAPFIATIGLTLVAVFFASAIILLRTSPPTSWPVRLIDTPPLRFLGKYSYGIYVLHGLLTPVLERWFPTDSALAICGGSPVAASVLIVVAKTAVSVAAALVSWRCLEAPFLKLKRFVEYGGRADSPSARNLATPETTLIPID